MPLSPFVCLDLRVHEIGPVMRTRNWEPRFFRDVSERSQLLVSVEFKGTWFSVSPVLY